MSHRSLSIRCALAVLGVVLLAATGQAAAASIEVSQPVQITGDIHYERGQAIVFDGADYWLFYGRSSSVTGNYQNANPDVSDYAIYFKKAASVPGLAAATPQAVPGAGSCYLGEIGAAVHDGKVWAFAALPSLNYTGRRSLNGWYTGDGGASWTQVPDLADNLPDGAAHHDEVSFGGELFVMANYLDGLSGWYSKHTADPTAATISWSAAVPLNVTFNLVNGTGHFFVEAGDLYISILRTAPTKDNKILQHVASPEAWTELCTAASTGWDPTLCKVGGTYVLAQAPWTSDGGGWQHVIAWSSDTLASVLSGTAHMVSEARYGSNTWIDMWPIGFTDQGGAGYLFLTSERDLPGQEGTGNIWYLEVTWNPAHDHYTWVQEAVTAAVPGDVIALAAGTYEEQVHVATENLSLQGAGVDQTILTSPTSLPLSFNTGSNDNYAVVFVDGIASIELAELTVDGLGRGNSNFRFVGIGFWNSGGTLHDAKIINIMDTPLSGAQHGVSIYSYNDTGGPYTITLTDVTVTDFQKNALALLGPGLTVDLDRVTTVGAGATDVTAQNGIQVGAGAGGTVDDCTISDVAYTGGSWAASGFLPQGGTSVTATGLEISGCQVGVYWSDTDGSFDQGSVSAPHGDAFYVYSSGAKTGGERPLPSPFDAELALPGGKSAVDVTISNSIFTGTGAADSWGVSPLSGGPVSFTLQNCVIDGWDYGVYAYDWGGDDITSAIHDNAFLACTFAVGSNVTAVQDASGNWFGTSDFNLVPAMFEGGVDFSPWLDDGTDTSPDPGFQGDFSALWLDAASPQTGGLGRIQEGLGLLAGSTLYVRPGTYVETGQVVLDEDVTIIGCNLDRPVVMTDSDTGGSGDPRGMWLVQPGVHVSLLNLVFDGTGHLVYQGIRSHGGGNLSNCSFRNMRYAQYLGMGLAVMDADWIIQDCTFENIERVGVILFGSGVTASSISGCTYTGKGDGDWLDYGVELGAGAVATLTSNTVTGCTGVASSDGSTSAGVLITTYFGPGTAGTLNGNTLTGNTTGIAVGYDGSDTAVVVARDNDLSGNASYGIEKQGTPDVDAIQNWWGDASGPYHATLNPTGLGVPVSDNVLFEPWTGMAALSAEPAASGPINCSQSVVLTFHYVPDGLTPALRGYEITIAAGSELSWDLTDIVDAGGLGDIGTHYFDVADNGDGSFSVADALLGPTPGLTAPADLFTVTFHGAGDGLADVQLVAYKLRDLLNQDIYATLTGATIEVDCTAPAPVTAITAGPGHQKVAVTWTDPASDVAQVEIWRGLWHDGSLASAYPEYDDLPADKIPDRPASRAAADASPEWELAGTVAAGTESFTDTGMTTGRGVYYYECFAVDAASNFSSPAAAGDRATNYWLGDVYPQGVYDALVDNGDITVLGSSWYVGDGETGYDAHCDVGPTDDHSRLGVPTTDNFIDLEDLMIFAMNYTVVGPVKGGPVPDTGTVLLAWARLDARTWSLQLTDPCPALKGLRVSAALPPGSVLELQAGELLTSQEAPFFLINADGRGLDVSLALLGTGLGLGGAGELFRVVLGQDVALEDLTVLARSVANTDLDHRLVVTTDVPLPRTFRLAQNFPNPFNPQTQICFDLPEVLPVRLTVLAVDGRRIATLVDEPLPAGSHRIVWDGRDARGQQVASGTYFYRIQAGRHDAVRKMILMK